MFYKLCYLPAGNKEFQAVKETDTEDGMMEASCVSDKDWDSFISEDEEVEEMMENYDGQFSIVIELNVSLS